jgi:hypothetical protein
MQTLQRGGEPLTKGIKLNSMANLKKDLTKRNEGRSNHLGSILTRTTLEELRAYQRRQGLTTLERSQ